AAPGLVARRETVRMAVDQSPLPAFEAENVGDAIRPLGRLFGAGEPDAGALDVRRHRQARRGHSGEVLVADRATALELLSRPVPASAHVSPALLVAAPAEERGDVIPMRVDRLDRPPLARPPRVHRAPEPPQRSAPTAPFGVLGHPVPPAARGLRPQRATPTNPPRSTSARRARRLRRGAADSRPPRAGS